MKKHESVEAYLAAQPPEVRRVLTRVRSVVKRAVPKAEEVISYGIPGYRAHGRVAVFFAGWKEHFSLYPVTEEVRAALGDEVAGLKFARGTLRFPYGDRLPVHTIGKLVKLMVARAAAVDAAKGKKSKKVKTARAPKRA